VKQKYRTMCPYGNYYHKVHTLLKKNLLLLLYWYDIVVIQLMFFFVNWWEFTSQNIKRI